MKYLKEYNSEQKDYLTYKGLYVTPLILDELYVRFLDMYDIDFQKSIGELVEFINQKYKDDLVVKMKPGVQPGLIANQNADIELIAIDISDFLWRKKIECRIVLAEGKIAKIENDIHRCQGELLVKIGRGSDETKNQTGIFSAEHIKVEPKWFLSKK